MVPGSLYVQKTISERQAAVHFGTFLKIFNEVESFAPIYAFDELPSRAKFMMISVSKTALEPESTIMRNVTTFSRVIRNSLAILIFVCSVNSQATFSIVAFDPQTRELGSAAATCVDDLDLGFFLSRFAPGKGAINAQSFVSIPNLLNGRQRLVDGESAQEVLDWLIANDQTGQPGLRQYLIVDMGDTPFLHSVTYTGADNFEFAGGITGSNYAIAGNILSGEAIIQQMEAAFVSTDGWLGEKLMAALQAANEPMADARCANTAALSGYISVTRADDVIDMPFMRLNSTSPNVNVDPINLLQIEFDAFVEENFSADADSDGVPDLLDNCINSSNEDQTDTDGDGYGNRCDADFNNDCVVNFVDFTELTDRILSTSDPLHDLNSDGVINFFDVLFFSEGFLTAPGPSGYSEGCN